MPTSRLPRSLRIGPYTYTLRVDDAAILAYQAQAGEIVGALTHLESFEMKFASTSSGPSTVLHEVLHVLMDQSGLAQRLGDEREEDTIQSLDHLLLGVLRANPALVAYLVA